MYMFKPVRRNVSLVTKKCSDIYGQHSGAFVFLPALVGWTQKMNQSTLTLKSQNKKVKEKGKPAAMRNITVVEGNLFDSKESLVHCVSLDLRMSKGIAVEFKKRFSGVDELQRQTPK
eukprot:gene24378-10401_t